jgi:hypothetical protein
VRTLEELFRLHAAEVLAYALRRTDAATAEDVSEVFLVAGASSIASPRTIRICGSTRSRGGSSPTIAVAPGDGRR